MNTQNIEPKKLIGIEIMSPDIAAMFAASKDPLSIDNTNFPTRTFAVIDIVYNVKNPSLI